MLETADGPLPPISERIIVIDNDRLLPSELSFEEITFLFDSTLSVLTEETEDKYWEERARQDRQSTYDTLTQHAAEFHGTLIPLSVFKPKKPFLGNDDIHFFRTNDDVYLTLYHVTDEQAKKQLESWKEEAKEVLQRPVTQREIEDYMHPGYQLFVHGQDEEAKTRLMTILEEKGFPVSRYRGLERDEPEPQEKQEDNRLYLGRMGGKFRQLYNDFYQQLTPTLIEQLQKEGKISAESAMEITHDEQAKRKYLYELTLTAYSEEMKTRFAEDAPERQGDFMKTYVKMRLMLNKL